MADPFRKIGLQLRHLQEQIDRLTSAPLGPVSLHDGDSIRLVNASGQTAFRMLGDNAELLYQGSLKTLPTILQTEQDARVQGDQNLQAADAAEKQARINADNTLADRIATKASKQSLADVVTDLNRTLGSIRDQLRSLEERVGALDGSNTAGGGSIFDLTVPGIQPDPHDPWTL